MNQRIAFEQVNQYADDEIDLHQLFATLWAGKWLVMAFTILFAAGGVAFALMKPDIYQASVLVAPANEEGGVKGLSGQLGGLASLAGINLGGGGSNQTVIAKEVLQSRAFLTDFIRRHQLAVPLKAVEGWNKENQQWLYNREVYNPVTKEWLKDDEGESFAPTDWDLVKAFKENHLSVSENKDTGMLTISIKNLSPVAAKEWARLLVADINEHMRKEDVGTSEARIAYLESKLEETSIAGMQQVFYQLIESETRTVMLANAQPEYVFKTLDPAVAPQEKSEPKRTLIVVLAVMLGGMLGVFVVFLRAFLKSDQIEPKS
ncbi:LPS O-antigen chain length determinant protein, WzzB/FepE family [Marinobacter antarcticus]|uniref:LPS O-antigen chain length determinant protein, WzzB/FepE family n=1 Tax=Marinobacter antarcticus TaxID=564117 RepID=A0A1M6RVY3_9GAMM|nr:Wzz/FepE/Etk N-terminal domain-containing protein [Marinobacter antarcticus]SHK36614.1 LPS O-antigen chain length determinant protein, WzzB/FepE family [Marinobacter antarcticus]